LKKKKKEFLLDLSPTIHKWGKKLKARTNLRFLLDFPFFFDLHSNLPKFLTIVKLLNGLNRSLHFAAYFRKKIV
jgi:hypothetical protein